MTNYCQSRVTIEGSPEAIGAFVQDCLTLRDNLHVLDFEKILPMPPILKGLHRSVGAKFGGQYYESLSSGVVGMEALKRAPLAPRGGFVGAESVLDNARVRAAGINSYDDLERWLRDNDPGSLELGRRCLAAQEATGFCFEDDWVMEKWGCDPDRVEYHASVPSETGYDAAFVSPWSAPEGIFREIARRHPKLTIRFVALEEGNEYAFLLTAENGVVNEEQPAITDAFIDEVEGSGEAELRVEAERSFYEEPATLEVQPIRHFRHWLNEARLKRVLVGYPVYDPPHRGIEMMMPERDARENYEFFLAQKADRVEGLRRFLQPFGVSLDFTEQTKDQLDTWLATYAAFLYVLERGSSFLTHDPGWTGARLGFNVIFDLALFLGDFAIHESPGLRWEMDVQTEPGRTRSDHQFQRSILTAAAPLFHFSRDVIYEVYSYCHSQCEASYLWKEARYRFGSRSLARQFATKTLRDINLCARGDFEAASREAWKDSLAQ